MKKKIKIEVASDVVCPWCYIGKRRLERAIEVLKDSCEFDISYLPFELNPSLPLSGVPQKQYLSDKFGGMEKYAQITNHVTKIAASEGLTFNFDMQEKIPNTRKAHHIIQFAKTVGLQAAVKEAFMKAYFEEGIDLSKNENLIRVATHAGLDKDTLETLLISTEGLHQIEKMETELHQLGISGVPFFIINGKYGISGAQSTEVFLQAFENIASTTEHPEEACDVNSKTC